MFNKSTNSVKNLFEEIKVILSGLEENLLYLTDDNIDILKDYCYSNSYLSLISNYDLSCLVKHPVLPTLKNNMALDRRWKVIVMQFCQFCSSKICAENGKYTICKDLICIQNNFFYITEIPRHT